MSFALPSIKVKPDPAQSVQFDVGNYGVPELMKTGIADAVSLESCHPIAASEKNYHAHRNGLNMTVLRNTQGLHAPLRISMELNAAKKVGRLPFLQSSNAMYDSLMGRDLEIGPEDVFNTAEFREIMGMPHAMVEKSLGML